MKKPLIIENDNVVYFDVDETIVMWEPKSTDEIVSIAASWGITERLAPNQKIIKKIKQHAMQGHWVVVHTQAGWDWALTVIKALKLEEYVSEIKTKPKWMYDDLPPSAWTNVIYPKDIKDGQVEE